MRFHALHFSYYTFSGYINRTVLPGTKISSPELPVLSAYDQEVA